MGSHNTPEAITESRIIICEGIDDQRFFSAFIQTRGINGLQVIKHAGGKSKFEERLNALEPQIMFKQTKAILLVVDSDDSPSDNFTLVAKQIKNTKKYGIPTEYKKRAKQNGRPCVAILGIPDGSNGNIETMLMDIIAKIDRYAKLCKCIQTYMKCSEAKTWSIGKQSKMKMHCFLAGTCEDAPESNIFDMWQENKGCRHLLRDAKFNDLDGFLRTFATW